MAVVARSRSFNDKVRERIFGFGSGSGSRISNASSSSGSEHEADSDFASSTSSSPPCLSYLVQNFIENAEGGESSGDGDRSFTNDGGGSSSDYLSSDPEALICEVIDPIVKCNDDRFRRDLVAHASRAVEAFTLFNESQEVVNRNVMTYLRQIGYNAGVCKAKWNATPGGGLPAGSYEFIDVQTPDPTSRYIIDLNFAAQFEIARGTESYRRLLAALPRVFVGKTEDLKKLLRLMSDETRRSMKTNEMTLPPWRKNRYFQAKWLGPYRRTMNQLPLSKTATQQSPAVKCRSLMKLGTVKRRSTVLFRAAAVVVKRGLVGPTRVNHVGRRYNLQVWGCNLSRPIVTDHIHHYSIKS